jgi:hypothetical protein
MHEKPWNKSFAKYGRYGKQKEKVSRAKLSWPTKVKGLLLEAVQKMKSYGTNKNVCLLNFEQTLFVCWFLMIDNNQKCSNILKIFHIDSNILCPDEQWQIMQNVE